MPTHIQTYSKFKHVWSDVANDASSFGLKEFETIIQSESDCMRQILSTLRVGLSVVVRQFSLENQISTIEATAYRSFLCLRCQWQPMANLIG